MEWPEDETLRLYSPFPTFFRTSFDRDELGEHVLPPKSAIIVSPFVTHHDGRYWDDPDRFDPERFAAGRNSQRRKEAYYPFGMGQRLCIGANLSLLEQHVHIPMVAQRFRRQLVDDYILKPHYDIARRPRHGVPMILTPR